MSGRAVERVERAINTVAAAVFAAAIGYLVVMLLRGAVDPPLRSVLAAVSTITAYLLCALALRYVADRACAYRMAEFTVLPLEPVALNELVLTDADRLQQEHPAVEEALTLDDILPHIGPDSRVVRLFDHSAMPSPRQLQSPRTDRAAPADASQALFEALAELRRSLA